MKYYTTMDSPVGPLLLVSNGQALTGLYMVEHRHGLSPASDWVLDDSADPFPEVRAQLQDYFAGALTEFDLPLAPKGTDFQLKVWNALRAIPYGETISYAELARRVGSPAAVRAVGQANGHNPISIIVPCHRVIGASGRLTGYGGGLDRKAALLDLERRRELQLDFEI